MKAYQLSDHQRALLMVLVLRARTLDELQERWRYALRTIRSCDRLGLVTMRGQFVELTLAGHRLLEEAADAAEHPEVVT